MNRKHDPDLLTMTDNTQVTWRLTTMYVPFAPLLEQKENLYCSHVDAVSHFSANMRLQLNRVGC